MLFPGFVAWIWYLPYLSHTLIIQPAIDFKDFVGPQGSKAGKCREYTPPLTSPCFLFWPCFSSLFSFQLLTHFTLLLFLAASVGPFCFPMTISSAREKQDDIYVSFLAIHSMLPVWEVLKQWEMHQDNGALPPFEHNIYIHLLEMCTHMGFWMICRSLKNRKDGKMECVVFYVFFCQHLVVKVQIDSYGSPAGTCCCLWSTPVDIVLMVISFGEKKITYHEVPQHKGTRACFYQ